MDTFIVADETDLIFLFIEDYDFEMEEVIP